MSQRFLVGLGVLVFLSLAGCSPVTPPPEPNKAPTAELEATPTEGFAPLTVQFDASKSKDPDGKITEYRWDFGDGATEAGADKAKVSHTYEKTGQYKVKLLVKDDKGASGGAERTITAQEKPEPPKQVTDKTDDNAYITLKRTYPSVARVGEIFTITLKATAKQKMPALLLHEGDENKGLPSALVLQDGSLKEGKLHVQAGQSVTLTYTAKATQEGKIEVRGVAFALLENGQPTDVHLTTKLNIVK